MKISNNKVVSRLLARAAANWAGEYKMPLFKAQLENLLDNVLDDWMGIFKPCGMFQALTFVITCTKCEHSTRITVFVVDQ